MRQTAPALAVTLWHIELSHYSEKVRFALAHKGISHRARLPLLGAHQAIAMALTRSTHRRMPVLELDGRAIGDSTAIIAALEERFPERPLYPADRGERARALALEDHFDEHLGPAVRAFGWSHLLAHEGGIGRTLATTRPAMSRFLDLCQPAIAAVVRRDYGATAEQEATARAGILAAADRLEDELGDGDHMVGDRFTVADLTAAALFTPTLAPPERPYLLDTAPPAVLELRAELEARRAGQWVGEMYRRHRSLAASGLR